MQTLVYSGCPPTKITDSDKTNMGQKNNCRNFKVRYCKFETKCRHENIEEVCKAKSFDEWLKKTDTSKYIWYSTNWRKINLCQFKHNMKKKTHWGWSNKEKCHWEKRKG